MKKEELLSKIRKNIGKQYDMPSFDDMKGVAFDNPQEQFIDIIGKVGGRAVVLEDGKNVNELIKSLYPEAKEIASNVEGITIATKNPDTVAEAKELNGTDLGIVEGKIAVAENGCVWVPQTMKEKAVCFISEYLVILVNRNCIVNNMHEAYQKIEMPDYGYGCFISGPSKTADIAQALVMGAQAARGVTVIIV
ncbi:MAG: LUD domain-containing protein [Prevotella sp.]|nr:LUD domain-containing protein [Prevotella sp.]